MDQLKAKLSYLFSRYKNGSCTAAERKMFLELVQQAGLEEIVKELISAETLQVDEGLVSIDREQSSQQAAEMLQAILTATEETTPVVSIKEYSIKRKWLRYVAAAAILVFAVGGYFLINDKKTAKSIIAKTAVQDVNPGSYKARLTLADGSTIALDSTTPGELAKQGNTVVTNKDGQLIYNTTSKDGEVLYNTVSTAKGETYHMTLADGSSVWLNSGSSIHFPVAFPGKERRIEITGEVYVKVAKNAAQPFIASVSSPNGAGREGGGMEVLALGTEFNINSYPDEESINTTLIEGSVKINSSITLKPGQQTQFSNGQLTASKQVNTDEVTGWKHGFFHFESADLKTILRQFARWYDIEVVYEGSVTQDRFFVIMNRNSSLATVLKALQAGGVKFTIESKRLIVKST